MCVNSLQLQSNKDKTLNLAKGISFIITFHIDHDLKMKNKLKQPKRHLK